VPRRPDQSQAGSGNRIRPGPALQAARLCQTRPIPGCAAMAFPADVRTAATRDGGDGHVSGQQPVTTSTALGWSVHPLRARGVRPHGNISINTHTCHTLIRSVAESRGGTRSLSLRDRVVSTTTDLDRHYISDRIPSSARPQGPQRTSERLQTPWTKPLPAPLGVDRIGIRLLERIYSPIADESRRELHGYRSTGRKDNCGPNRTGCPGRRRFSINWIQPFCVRRRCQRGTPRICPRGRRRHRV
jgi:hypothetical protein